MENLYLTAILPPEQLTEQIDEIRKECAEKFNVKAGLKPPVHITLFRPFKLESEREEHLLKILNPVTYNYDPFEISLENFDTFHSHVVFIRVTRNKELLDLQHEISGIYNRNKIDFQEVKSRQSFKPHITIAYRDIPAPIFPNMWSEYKDRKFKRRFLINHFTLLKHDGKRWQRFKDYYLKKEAELSLF
jgi:2'-5' RNA ligase